MRVLLVVLFAFLKLLDHLWRQTASLLLLTLVSDEPLPGLIMMEPLFYETSIIIDSTQDSNHHFVRRLATLTRR
jgi:hypothetical protein